MRSPRTLLATTALLGAVLAPLTACTGDEGEQPQDAAEALATALSRGKLAPAPFDAAEPKPQRWWDRTTEGMGESTAAVSVGEVTEAESGEAATAALSYSWTLEGGEETWEHQASARLARVQDGSWQVLLGPELVGLRKGEVLDLDSETAARAPILGADGVEIVKDRPVLRFGVDKAQAPAGQQEAVARELAAIVDVDAGSLVERVKAAGDEAFVEAIVLREEDATQALRQAADVDGIGVLEDTLPLAPTREFARPILGSVGPVTAEIVKASKGAYEAGDEAGLSGLQQRYDEQLRGTPGLVVEAVKGERTRTLHEVAPKAGKPLATTLDVDLQTAAERVLADVGPAAALVAIRPSTGAIVAAANGPGSEGYSTATVGQYAPGSTFKVVSSLALLRAGLTLNSPVSCPASTVVDGKTFENYDDYPSGGLGRITLREAVSNSCNTAFITARDRVEDLPGAAAALGLGVDHDLGFPAYFGGVPDLDATDSETSRAASLIGQGQVLASPMAMAAVAASVAEGATVVPRLLPGHPTDDAKPDRPLTEAEAGVLRDLMRSVVTEGSGALLADVPGPPVLAKTGTAEFGSQTPLRTHAWMISVQGDLAVAAFVEVGESGSRTAGPLLEELLRSS